MCFLRRNGSCVSCRVSGLQGLSIFSVIDPGGHGDWEFRLESARECGRMIIIGMAFGAIPDFVPFLGKSLETLVDKLLSMINE